MVQRHTLKYLFLILFGFCSVQAQEKKPAQEKILVLTEQLYPLSYTETGSDNSKSIGFAVELAEAVLDEAQLPYDINMVPWSRAIKVINKRPNVLIITMSRTEPREEQFHWIGEVFPKRTFLYGLSKNEEDLPKSFEEAKEYKVGVLRGNIVDRFLEANGFRHLVKVSQQEQYLRLLARERIDIFSSIDYRLSLLQQRQGIAPGHFVQLFELPEVSKNIFMVTGKNTKLDIVNKLKRAYVQLKKDGRYDEIVEPLRTLINTHEIEPNSQL